IRRRLHQEARRGRRNGVALRRAGAGVARGRRDRDDRGSARARGADRGQREQLREADAGDARRGDAAGLSGPGLQGSPAADFSLRRPIEVDRRGQGDNSRRRRSREAGNDRVGHVPGAVVGDGPGTDPGRSRLRPGSVPDDSRSQKGGDRRRRPGDRMGGAGRRRGQARGRRRRGPPRSDRGEERVVARRVGDSQRAGRPRRRRARPGEGELTMALIELRGVTKSYQRDSNEIVVLDGVTISIAEGDFMALMGPSGSGKSTLLNLLAGIDRPTRGAITVAGTDISGLSERALAAWRARHIGFIFQLYNLIPVLTAFENVELPLLLTGLTKKQRRDHVLTALGIVGLSDREKHYPRQLSGGQEQRVAIARAIVTDPTLLLADEPTGDLDAKSAAEILTLLQRLNRDYKKTIVMVTHDPHAAERASHVVHLEKGTLAETVVNG